MTSQTLEHTDKWTSIFELVSSNTRVKTHFGWPGGTGLGHGSVILFEVFGQILSGINLAREFVSPPPLHLP
ncbi:hypothetical protein MTR_1g112690 [Medicago truncatula]|uniref:Uncharacterized protein n=1 Tax=Medicago truncatula TaxID=3880 RepID=A0A072VSK2_MEDTR|nr:hypothetical protein MTR_1g112690 [Medicago truncatula]